MAFISFYLVKEFKNYYEKNTLVFFVFFFSLLAVTAKDFLYFFEKTDFDYAKNLLSPNLSETLSKETIEQYFGKFDDCKIVNYYSNPSVVLFFKNEAKVFGASFLESKIVDIFEIN